MSASASIRANLFLSHFLLGAIFPVADIGAGANPLEKEMVSLRGVAKKRREQGAACSVNQMFAYCCGPATIVAQRQPLFSLINDRAVRADVNFARARWQA
jgi:hypothetical protein